MRWWAVTVAIVFCWLTYLLYTFLNSNFNFDFNSSLYVLVNRPMIS